MMTPTGKARPLWRLLGALTARLAAIHWLPVVAVGLWVFVIVLVIVGIVAVTEIERAATP